MSPPSQEEPQSFKGKQNNYDIMLLEMSFSDHEEDEVFLASNPNRSGGGGFGGWENQRP